jgi:hypothetical protein
MRCYIRQIMGSRWFAGVAGVALGGMLAGGALAGGNDKAAKAGKPAGAPAPARPDGGASAPVKPAVETPGFPFQLPAGFKREDLKKLKGAGFAKCEKIMEGLADACETDGTYWQIDIGRFSTNKVELRFHKNQLYGVVMRKDEMLECAEAQGALTDAVRALRAKYPKAEAVTGATHGSKECSDLARPDSNFWQIAVGDMRIKVDVKVDTDAYFVWIDYKHRKAAEALDLAYDKAKSDKRNKGLEKL